MGSIIDQIRARAVTETEYSGIVYRLRACVQEDLLLHHVAVQAILTPPSQMDRLSEAAIAEATGADKADLMRTLQREMIERVSNPENQALVLHSNVAFTCASVLAADAGEGWQDIRVVATEAEGDTSATPPRIWCDHLPPGTVQHIGGTARILSFGGEEARKSIRSFRGERGTMPAIREGSEDIRPPAVGTPETNPAGDGV